MSRQILLPLPQASPWLWRLLWFQKDRNTSRAAFQAPRTPSQGSFRCPGRRCRRRQRTSSGAQAVRVTAVITPARARARNFFRFMVVSSFFLGVFDTSIIPPPPPNASAIRAGFGAIHAEKSPRGGRNSLGAWHFGGIVWGEGLQGCCLGQARLRTTSQSHSVRQLP